jgi:hypothetical protein
LNVSQRFGEIYTFIFRVEKEAEQDTTTKADGKQRLDPENGSGLFLRMVS